MFQALWEVVETYYFSHQPNEAWFAHFVVEDIEIWRHWTLPEGCLRNGRGLHTRCLSLCLASPLPSGPFLPLFALPCLYWLNQHSRNVCHVLGTEFVAGDQTEEGGVPGSTGRGDAQVGEMKVNPDIMSMNVKWHVGGPMKEGTRLWCGRHAWFDKTSLEHIFTDPKRWGNLLGDGVGVWGLEMRSGWLTGRRRGPRA